MGGPVWRVVVSPEAEKEIKALKKAGKFSDDDAIVICTWAETIIKCGPEALKDEPSVWADHELYGEWKGHRASSYSYSGRIIYRVENEVVTVVVVRITPKHDYRK